MEQSYKEKYENLLARLEKAKNDNEVCDERFCCVINDLIPELAESEDEKIRKEIVRFIQMEVEDEIVGNKWLAWLGKQGNYANFRDKAQVGDRITKNEDGVLVNLSQLKRVAKPSEKQGEQKVGYTTIMETGDGGINALETRELSTDDVDKLFGMDLEDYL